MASVTQLVSEIVHAVGQPNNHVLRRTVRSAVYHELNEKIRRQYQNHGYVDKVLQQRYRVELVDTTEGDVFSSLSSIQAKVKRTKNRVPRPVRLPNNLPFMSVRSVGFSGIEIPFVKEANSRFYKELPGMCALPNYDYINGYIYINGNGNSMILGLNHIVIESPFEIPTEVPIETSESKESFPTDDDEFMIPEDMVENIKETIFKRNFLNIPRDTNEVPVKDELQRAE